MPELSIEAQQKVLELRKMYIDSFPEKINKLKAYWSNLETNQFSQEVLEDFRKACHKIAGSSGSYELLEISKAANLLEQLSSYERWVGDKAEITTDLRAQYLTLLSLLEEEIL